MGRRPRAMADGALGGLVATTAMSAFMLAARGLGLLGEPPPKKIGAAALDRIGLRRRSEETENATAVLLHYGFGVGAGALFGMLHGALRRLGLPIGAPLHGIDFGTLVWLVSYAGWVPAFGIMPPPERDRPGRPVVMVLAHWIYGSILGAVVGRRDRAVAG